MTEGERWISLDELPTILPAVEANGKPESSWVPINLAELPDKPPARPELGGLGIAYAGKRHVFSGPQESAKTLLAYALGLEVLRAGGGFCLIDFEMGAWDARTRLRELGASDDELGAIIYFEPFEPISQSVVQGIIVNGPALVMIDAAAGAYDAQGLDDNKRQDVEKFTTAYVRAFWRHGVSTIVIDHVVKDSESRGRYAIGSERKVGGADVHIGFEIITPISRGGHGRYKLMTHKDRGGFLHRGKLAELDVRSDPVTHAITWELDYSEQGDEIFRPTHLMEKVSRFLQDNGESSKNSIEDGVKGRREFVRQALDRLVVEGFASESEGARNARMFTSIRAFFEAHDDFAPPRPDLAPDEVNPPRPTSPPPSGGRDEVDAPSANSTSPATEDDGIPF